MAKGRKKAAHTHNQNVYRKGAKHDTSKHVVIVVIVVFVVVVGGGWMLLNWLSMVCCLSFIVHTNTESYAHHQKFLLPNTANEWKQQQSIVAGILYPILMLVFLKPNIFAVANYFDPSLEMPACLCTQTNTHARQNTMFVRITSV